MRVEKPVQKLEPASSGVKTPLDLKAIDFLIGQVLESRYRIDAEVGRGGMGVVYRGTDLTLSRPVAIKTILHKQSDDEALNRFIFEAKTLAQIENPRLVPVYAVGQDEGYHYIVMKFLEGETLASRLKRDGAQSPDFTRDIIQQVCEALHALHSKDLIHRDIKPANLMISPKGTITVMDLGIVKRVGEDNPSVSGIAIGTPRYMPPEAVDNKALDPRADLYSLGVIAYQMLVGETPFNGATPMAILYQQAHEQPARVREKTNQVPKNLDLAVDIALQKLPEKRFQSALEMAEAFQSNTEFIEPGQWRFKVLIFMTIAGILGLVMSKGDIFQWQRSLTSSNPGLSKVQATHNKTSLETSPDRSVPNKNELVETKSSRSNDKIRVNKTVEKTKQSTPQSNQKMKPNNTVKVWLKSQPRNAKIYLGKRYIGRTPYKLTKKKGETKVFTLKLKGFKNQRLVVKDGDAKAQLRSVFGGF